MFTEDLEGRGGRRCRGVGIAEAESERGVVGIVDYRGGGCRDDVERRGIAARRGRRGGDFLSFRRGFFEEVER